MKTQTKTVEEITNGAECPFPIGVIPNNMEAVTELPLTLKYETIQAND
jgi:hypothetical protein